MKKSLISWYFDIDNGRVVYDFRIGKKIPSQYPVGLVVDTKGFIYVAMYNGGAVWKIDPK